MRKTLIYSSFLVASLLVILIFITAGSYIQLAVAAVSYLPLAIVGMWLLPRKPKSTQINQTLESGTVAQDEETDIPDLEKRAFLKFIGAAGVSFFLFSILNKRIGGFFPEKNTASGISTLEDTEGNKINPAEKQPTDGYKISEIDNNTITYYGFTNKDGGWFIMKEDTDTGSFRYAKGEKSFSDNWSQREKLQYDYYFNIF